MLNIHKKYGTKILYMARIYIGVDIQRLEVLLREHPGIYYSSPYTSIASLDLTIEAATRPELESQIAVAQANMLAVGLIPLMFKVRRWEIDANGAASEFSV